MATFAELSSGVVETKPPLYKTGIEVSTNNNLIFTKFDQTLHAIEKVAIKYLSAKAINSLSLQNILDGHEPIYDGDPSKFKNARHDNTSLFPKLALFNRIFNKLHSFFKFTTNSHFVTFAYEHEGLDENGKLKNAQVIELALDDKNYELFQSHFCEEK